MKTGILLTNTGTPDAATPKAVRRYLQEFLLDKRIVKIPRLVWLPILYGLILTTRPKRSAKLYQQIWGPHGSPMRVLMNALALRLENKLGNDYVVALGMNYGTPSIEDGIQQLKQRGAERFLILPLFPQYSNTSTGSSFDRVVASFSQVDLDKTPLRAIRSYATNEQYINMLSQSIQAYWKQQSRENHLLISFHGIPKRLVNQGDPYQHECEMTAEQLASRLKLAPNQWTLCYQSQFGYDKWLKPSTQELLLQLPQQGHRHIDIVCPGFAIDCLETLEEIAKTGRGAFISAGGETLNYIPALNDSDRHVNLLTRLIREQYSLGENTMAPIKLAV